MILSSRLKKSAARAMLAAVAAATLATPALAWWETDYAYRTRINLNMTAASVTGEVARAPVLVRLHQGNFSFTDVKPDGSDLRFVAGDDRTPLTFTIEKWSPQEQQALIWVDVNGLKPGATSAIYAYYGSKDAKPQQNAAGTFSDYKAVYHFDGQGPVRDGTANGLNTAGAQARNTSGLIGQSLRLDGATALALPASAIPAGRFSIGFWVKPGSSDGQLLTIPGSATLAYAGGTVSIEAGGQRSDAVPLTVDRWSHVALVNDGQTTRLFIGGQPAADLAGTLPAATGPMLLGQGFTGEIDELRVADTALPQAAFQLAAASEGQGPKLLTFDTAEEAEGAGHNYFGILFAALTLDAWVVIGLLAIMSLISWIVMIGKGLMLSRVTSANDDFLDAYEQASVGRSDHDGLADFPMGARATESTLARLYHIGKRELQKRLVEGRASGSRFAIRGQSISAIRSALDTGQVRESQRINRQMVLLTIAISGGPFIGLLGTVLGVMITFASVAAAGEVNINAIAPGIAAALLATVAGLAVAIPALFGYNYLISRTEEIAADNQIFVDELEKRIAETWQDVDGPTPAAIAAE